MKCWAKKAILITPQCYHSVSVPFCYPASLQTKTVLSSTTAHLNPENTLDSPLIHRHLSEHSFTGNSKSCIFPNCTMTCGHDLVGIKNSAIQALSQVGHIQLCWHLKPSKTRLLHEHRPHCTRTRQRSEGIQTIKMEWDVSGHNL